MKVGASPEPSGAGAASSTRTTTAAVGAAVRLDRIQTTDATLSGGGRSAMLMYKAAADRESYIAYQP